MPSLKAYPMILLGAKSSTPNPIPATTVSGLNLSDHPGDSCSALHPAHPHFHAPVTRPGLQGTRLAIYLSSLRLMHGGISGDNTIMGAAVKTGVQRVYNCSKQLNSGLRRNDGNYFPRLLTIASRLDSLPTKPPPSPF